MNFLDNSCSVECTRETLEHWTDLLMCNTNKDIKESASEKKEKEMQEIFSTGADTRKQVLLNTIRVGIRSMNFLAVSTMYY